MSEMCKKCGAKDIIAINSTSPNATTIIMFDRKEITRENIGSSQVKITICKNCNDVIAI